MGWRGSPPINLLIAQDSDFDINTVVKMEKTEEGKARPPCRRSKGHRQPTICEHGKMYKTRARMKFEHEARQAKRGSGIGFGSFARDGWIRPTMEFVRKKNNVPKNGEKQEANCEKNAKNSALSKKNFRKFWKRTKDRFSAEIRRPKWKELVPIQ